MSKQPRLKFSEGGLVEGPQKPYLTIGDIQVYIEDLPEEGQQIFGRLQRLSQKKANAMLDLEEMQAGIDMYSNRVVQIYSADAPEQPNDSESTEEES